jgi:hypothetical protein
VIVSFSGGIGSTVAALFVVCTGTLKTCSIIDVGAGLLDSIQDSLEEQYGTDTIDFYEAEGNVFEAGGAREYAYGLTTETVFDMAFDPAEFVTDTIVGTAEGTYDFFESVAPDVDIPLNQIHPTEDYFELANRARSADAPNANQLFEFADHLGEKADDVKIEDFIP